MPELATGPHDPRADHVAHVELALVERGKRVAGHTHFGMTQKVGLVTIVDSAKLGDEVARIGAAHEFDAHRPFAARAGSKQDLSLGREKVGVGVVQPKANLAAHAVRPRDLRERHPPSLRHRLVRMPQNSRCQIDHR